MEMEIIHVQVIGDNTMENLHNQDKDIRGKRISLPKAPTTREKPWSISLTLTEK